MYTYLITLSFTAQPIIRLPYGMDGRLSRPTGRLGNTLQIYPD
jgi:hypothetical protein